MSPLPMTLKIFFPAALFLEEKVVKIKAEGYEGAFSLKPKHIDYATALVPGIFSYSSLSGRENYLAIDEGILVKQGQSVYIITRRAFSGELGRLGREVEKMLTELNEQEKRNRSAVARLEIGFIKRFLEFSHRS